MISATGTISWLRKDRIGEQKSAKLFCEAVNFERSEKEGKFLFLRRLLAHKNTLQAKASQSVSCANKSRFAKEVINGFDKRACELD